MSAAAAIPDHVRRFIYDHIESVEQVELLLLLRKESGRAWSADELAKELRLNAGSAAMRLLDLRERGFVTEEKPEQYRFDATRAELARDVDGLAREYVERRTSVINLIFSKPTEKIRTFADAFKFRKDS